MPGKQLTLEEKEIIKTLLAGGKTFHAVAIELKKSPHTVEKYAKQAGVMEAVKEKQAGLIELYSDIATSMLNSIDDDSINKLNAYQRTISAGIATDKMRLLKGESTSNELVIMLNVPRNGGRIQGDFGKKGNG